MSEPSHLSVRTSFFGAASSDASTSPIPNRPSAGDVTNVCVDTKTNITAEISDSSTRTTTHRSRQDESRFRIRKSYKHKKTTNWKDTEWLRPRFWEGPWTELPASSSDIAAYDPSEHATGEGDFTEMVFELGIPSERKLDRRGKSTLLQSYIIEETRKFHGPYPYPYEDSQIKKYWVEITAKIQPRTYLHALGCQSKECVGYHLDEFPDIANTDELDEDQGKEQAKEPTGDTSNKDSEGRTICNPSRLLSELENDGDLRIQDETDLKEWLEEQSKIQGEGEGHVARVFKGYYIVKPWSDAYFFKPHGTHWTEYTVS